MNAGRFVREGGKARAIFCLVLVVALVCSVFALNGFAAGAGSAGHDVKVDSCATHTAAVSNGLLYMWGSNDRGQFPDSELPYSVDPVQAAEGVADVAVSEGRTLVVYDNGDLVAYGADPLGGTDKARKIASNAARVVCGNTFAMYLTTSGDLMAWGSNQSGQLGVASVGDRSEPIRVLGSIKEISAGPDFALAVADDGTAYGWGDNSAQQLGIQEENGPTTVSTPTQIAENVKTVDAGGSYSCILKQDGSLYTCGLNSFNQTGYRSFDSIVPLTRILENVKVASVSAGDTHGFAMDEHGTIYRWGYGLSGQLGTGDDQRVIGAAAANDLDFTQVFAGVDTSFGVDAEGCVWAWGANVNRLLCTPSGENSLEPVKVLNADMSWAYSEQDAPNEPDFNAGGSDEPVVVTTPFVGGDDKGLFRPDDQITRAEFLKMVVVALTDFDEKKDYGAVDFDDVKDDWYVPYVSYAVSNRLVNGYDDGTFRPNDPITRAAAAKITAIALDLPTTAETSSFTDVGKDNGTEWAIPFVEALYSKNIVGGVAQGKFAPKDMLKRSEATKIIGAIGFDVTDEASMALVKQAENPFTKDVDETAWYYPYVLFAAGALTPAA